MKLIQKIDNYHINRNFVKFKKEKPDGTTYIYHNDDCEKIIVTIIIPTLDKNREGYLPKLIEQIKKQTYKNWELILVCGDTRQGRAINCGVSVAKGKYIIILDDDTQITQNTLVEKMVHYMNKYKNIGMAGVSNLIPPNANILVKSVMLQIPRRTSSLVKKITDSDLAEHPCCIIPREVFINIGGENELIPRGLDPYLRNEIRKAGYRVVVLPGLYIHHLPPKRFSTLVKQLYRNGKMAAYVNKFYSQFVVDLSFKHDEKVVEKRSFPYRVARFGVRLLLAVLNFQLYYLLSMVLYSLGFTIGYLTLKENDL